jgi:hypothetical protein
VGQNLLEALLLYQRIDVDKKISEMGRKKNPSDVPEEPKFK